MLKRHDLATDKTMIIFYSANIHFINGRVQAFFKPTAGINIYGTRQCKLFLCKTNKQCHQSIFTSCERCRNVEQFNKLNNLAAKFNTFKLSLCIAYL